MERVFVRSWRALALRGAVSLAFGVVALAWPAITLSGLVIFFGAYALLDGFIALGAAARPDVTSPRIPVLVLEAMFGIGIGMAALLWTGMTAIILVWLVGLWAIVTGVLEVMLAAKLRGKVPGDTMLAIAGLGSLAAGLLMVVWPQTTALVFVVLLGGYALFFGTSMVVLALRLRQVMALPTPRHHSPHALS